MRKIINDRGNISANGTFVSSHLIFCLQTDLSRTRLRSHRKFAKANVLVFGGYLRLRCPEGLGLNCSNLSGRTTKRHNPHQDLFNLFGSKREKVLAGTQNKSDVIINLLKYNVWYTTRKKDAGKHYWFSFPNDLLTHPDFFGITGEEFKAFVWCVSVCSKVRQSEIRLNIPHSCSLLSTDQAVFFSMFDKLKGKQIDIIGDHTATIESHYSKATTEEKSREENTREEKRTGELKPGDEVVLFFEFWNSQEKLPKAMKLTSARRVKIKMRIKESGLENLKSVVLVITETPFLLGENDRSWKADLDWLVANEQNGLKVSEGKYKTNSTKAKSGSKERQVWDTAADQIEQIKRGEL